MSTFKAALFVSILVLAPSVALAEEATTRTDAADRERGNSSVERASDAVAHSSVNEE